MFEQIVNWQKKPDRSDEDILRHLEDGLAHADQVQAYQLLSYTTAELMEMTGGIPIDEIDPFDPDKSTVGLNVLTPTGMQRASLGHMLVHYEDKWFVMAPDRFKRLFEPIK